MKILFSSAILFRTCLITVKAFNKPSFSLFRLFSTTNNIREMSTNEWKPPAKIEDLFAGAAGNKWSSINSPVAGARVQQDVPVGSAPLQLYSLATPNGKKKGKKHFPLSVVIIRSSFSICLFHEL
jgi:hypothetical protein